MNLGQLLDAERVQRGELKDSRPRAPSALPPLGKVTRTSNLETLAQVVPIRPAEVPKPEPLLARPPAPKPPPTAAQPRPPVSRRGGAKGRKSSGMMLALMRVLCNSAKPLRLAAVKEALGEDAPKNRTQVGAYIALLARRGDAYAIKEGGFNAYGLTDAGRKKL